MNYFTPSIEDIRVGYEYEYMMGTQFKLVKITDLHPMQVGTIKAALETGLIRVPYLTKEQIEAEGWKTEMDKGNGVVDFSKANFTLSWNYNLRIIELNDGKTTTRFDNHLVRIGCKDINTFRYICKLLNINQSVVLAKTL